MYTTLVLRALRLQRRLRSPLTQQLWHTEEFVEDHLRQRAVSRGSLTLKDIFNNWKSANKRFGAVVFATTNLCCEQRRG